jgi:aminopeptidase N
VALDLLPEMMLRPSYQDVIRTRAIEGLGATGDERAVLLLRAEWHPGGPFPPRRAIVAALAEVAQGTLAARGVREFLEDRLADPDFRVRMAVSAALLRLADRAAVPAIERALVAELDGRARRVMRDAITELREGTRPTERLTRLKEEVERLRGETARLRERLDAIDARQGMTPSGGAPSGGGDASEPRAPKRPRPTTRRGGRPGRGPAPIRRRR